MEPAHGSPLKPPRSSGGGGGGAGGGGGGGGAGAGGGGAGAGGVAGVDRLLRGGVGGASHGVSGSSSSPLSSSMAAGAHSSPSPPPSGSGSGAGNQPSSSSASSPGYTLISKLGSGSFGDVYLGRDTSPTSKTQGRLVAVKIIDLDEEAQNESALDNIMREVAALGRCRSPHIVAYYGSRVEPGTSRLWIVMEYCGGRSVADHLASHGPFDECAIAGVMRGVFSGLAYLHANGVLHRDIKGANVLLTDAGGVRLGDFGVSGTLNETLGTLRQTFVGTPYWMAPEVIACGGSLGAPRNAKGNAGGSSATATSDLATFSPFAVEQPASGYNDRADVWSAGITACEMALGRPPRSDVHPMRALFLIAHDPPPSLPDGQGYSRALRDLVAKCLRRPTTKRPSAEALINHRFLKAYEPARTAAALADRVRSSGAAAPVTATAAAAAAAAAAAVDLDEEDPDDDTTNSTVAESPAVRNDGVAAAVPSRGIGGKASSAAEEEDALPSIRASTYALLRSVEETLRGGDSAATAIEASDAWSQLVDSLRKLDALDGARLESTVERAMRRRVAHGSTSLSSAVGEAPVPQAVASLKSPLGAFLLEQWKEGICGSADDIM